MGQSPLLSLQGVRKSFPKPEGGELLVLDDINLTVHESEIIGLLGRSGSGKINVIAHDRGIVPT